MTGLEGETLAVGVVVIFGIKPVTDSVLAIVRELRKPRGSRTPDTADGGGTTPPPSVAPHARVNHTVEHDGIGWVCRCGQPLGQTRAEAREAMKGHREGLVAARAGLNGAAA